MVQWQEALRKYPWLSTPGVPLKPPWDDTEAGQPARPILPPPPAPLPETDRIGRPDRDNPKFEYFKDRYAHLNKKEADWGPWEKFCFKMVAMLARVEPIYPDYSGSPSAESTGLLVSTLPSFLIVFSFIDFLEQLDCLRVEIDSSSAWALGYAP